MSETTEIIEPTPIDLGEYKFLQRIKCATLAWNTLKDALAEGE